MSYRVSDDTLDNFDWAKEALSRFGYDAKTRQRAHVQ